MALTPVISIPVDSSEFDKFAAAFGDYQQKLKEMPADWAATNTRIKELAAVQTALGVSADRAWSNATSAAMAYERTVKSAVTAQSNLAQTGLGAANTMRKMAAEARHMSDSLFNVARSITSFTTLGIGGGLLGLGGLTFGLDRLADSVLNRQRTAQGLGLTVGQYNSFKANMAQYAGLNVLQGAAGAKYDMSKWGYLTSLGVNLGNVQHEDATQIAAQEIWALHKAWKQNPTMQSTPALSALKLGMSESDVIRIGRAPDAPLRAALARLQPDASTLGFTAQVAQEWSAFSIQLHKAGVLIETALIKTLTPLTPQLTKLSGEVAGLIAGLERSGLVKALVNDLADGLKSLAAWLGSPSFKQDMHTFADDMVYAARNMVAAAKWIGLLPSSAGPTAPPGTAGAPALPQIPGQPVSGPTNMLAYGSFKDWRAHNIGFANSIATINQTIAQQAPGAGVPPDLVKRLFQAETSSGRGSMVSPAGALGWFQFMPGTAKQYSVDPWNAASSARGAISYLHDLYAKYHDWSKAVAAYNWKEASLDADIRAHGAQWLKYAPAETQREVAKVVPTIPAGVVPKAPAALAGEGVPGAPISGDLSTVLKNLRKITASKTTVTINNNTAAQVHVSTNAAAGG